MATKHTRNKLPEKIDNNPEHISDYSTSPIKAKREIFINEFVRTGDALASATAAGYRAEYGKTLLRMPDVNAEIVRRQQLSEEDGIATGNDAMRFLTEVMRGEVKDQFNLDATLSDRLVACKEILKRTKDIELKAQSNDDNNININIDWTIGGSEDEE